ncbi:hypothetical protein [Thalassoroseus pseudoceratinae]|uniref:hypothetical protein n=1 Tax=Thalassoroseus pseudoceratinae TaxID=2713176 RepID=UPI00141D90A2|nr:hypothetical protein [Thalassoroseus pseudoceratinae]
MIRKLISILGMCCLIIVLAEAGGLAWLWFSGELTPERLQRVRLAWDEEPSELLADEAVPEDRGIDTNLIMQQRVLRAFDLETRARELTQQAEMIVRERQRILENRLEFQTQHETFQAELKRIREEIQSEASEQARSVLSSLSAGDAVPYLMALDLDRNLVLLKELPAKTLGKILKEMSQGDDEQRQRSAQIFDALSRGEPEISATRTAEQTAATPKQPLR